MFHKVFNSSNNKLAIDKQLEDNISFNLSDKNLSQDDLTGENIARTEKAEQAIWQGIHSEKTGHLKEAISYYRSAIEEDPESAKAYQLLSQALKKMREQRQSKKKNREQYNDKNIEFGRINTDDGKFSHEEQLPEVRSIEYESSNEVIPTSKIKRTADALDQKQDNEPDFNLTTKLNSSSDSNFFNANFVSMKSSILDTSNQQSNKIVLLPEVHTSSSGELVVQANMAAAQVYVEQALVYFEQKHWQNSINACQEALRICPTIGQAYKVWGNCLQKSGDVAGAIGIYAKALEVQPDMAEIYCNLGNIYAKKKKWKQAISHYQKSSQIDIQNSIAYRNLARVWDQLGEYKKSTECFFKALEIEPTLLSAQDHFELAGNLLEESSLERAIACYKYCINIDPKFANAYVKLADALEQNGQTEVALFYYKKLARLQDSSNRLDGCSKSSQQIRVFLNPKANKQASENQSRTKQLNGNVSLTKPTPQLKPVRGIETSLNKQISEALKAVKRQPKSSDLLASLGNLYIQTQQWKNAINYYTRAVKLAPKEITYYLNLGKAWQKAGNEINANQALYQAFSIEPKQISAKKHFLLGNKLFKQEHYDLGVTCYLRAITNQPDFIESYWQLGKILTNQGKYRVALTCYKQAIKIHPNQVQSYLYLGKILIQLNQWQDAFSCYQQAAAIAPENADIYLSLGEISAHDQKWKEATELYTRALKISPQHWQIHHRLGETFSEQKLWKEAIEAFQKAIRFSSQVNSHQSYYNLGKAHSELNEWDKAVQAFKQSISINPNFSWSHYGLGSALIEQEQWTDAIKALNDSINLNPDFDWAYHKIGNAYTENGDWDAAVSAYRRALDITPGLPKTESKLSDLLRKRAALDVEEVEDYYKNVLEREPDQESSYFKALEVTPNNPEIYVKLAKLYQNKGSIEQAIAFYEIALQIDPNNAEIVSTLEKIEV